MQVAFLKSWGHCSTKCSCSQCPFLGEEARAEEVVEKGRAEEGGWGVGEEEHQERRPAVGESRAIHSRTFQAGRRASVVYQPNMGHK